MPQRPLPRARRPNDDGSLVCYGIVVATASLLLLAILAATVRIVKAVQRRGLHLPAVVRGGRRRSRSCCAAHDDGGDDDASRAGDPRRRACGLVGAAIDALPAFAYACHAAGTRGGGGEGSSSKSGRCVLCSVCLEDVEAGEMVRQLPACGHLFHVGCIDMWLHSHATCPLCRFDVVSPQPVGVKVTAAADPPDGALPPV